MRDAQGRSHRAAGQPRCLTLTDASVVALEPAHRTMELVDIKRPHDEGTFRDWPSNPCPKPVANITGTPPAVSRLAVGTYAAS